MCNLFPVKKSWGLTLFFYPDHGQIFFLCFRNDSEFTSTKAFEFVCPLCISTSLKEVLYIISLYRIDSDYDQKVQIQTQTMR